MTTPETQEPTEPIRNPNWDVKDEKRFDALDAGTGMPTAAARRILGLDEQSTRPKNQPKPVHGSIQREIADSDARVEPAIEQTTGGAAILDMDPQKRANDLEQIDKIRQGLEQSSTDQEQPTR